MFIFIRSKDNKSEKPHHSRGFFYYKLRDNQCKSWLSLLVDLKTKNSQISVKEQKRLIKYTPNQKLKLATKLIPIRPTIITGWELISHFYQFYFFTPFNIRKRKKNDLIF